MWPVEHKPFRHSTMRSGSSSSSSRFKIRPKQVNASTCDFDRCCLKSGDNTGTHLHVSRKAICRPKQQLHVSTSMESEDARTVAQEISGAQFYEFTGKGHAPLFTATSEFCEVVRQFVRKGL